jgi:uncharacterized membrane protein
MRWVIDGLWRRGIVSTFLTGLFAILPLALTVAILAWVVDRLRLVFGPDGLLGRPLQSLGFHVVSGALAAWAVGLTVVLAGIWLLGLLMKSVARKRIERLSNAVVGRIPIVKSVYGTVAQLVAMLKKDDQSELSGMSVVFCAFGPHHEGGILCLLTSPTIYRFGNRDYQFVYIPTAPLPMSGGLVFMPVEHVQKVDMSAEQLMRLYLSMGILSPQVIPLNCRGLSDSLERR